MRLKIKSNFFQLWFSAFDHDGLEFRMMNNEGPSRVDMFNLFKEHKIPHAFFGNYNDFLKSGFENSRSVVIYDDIRSHFGENKRICSFSELNTEDKLKYMSEYINTDKMILSDYLSKSTRYLVVGNNCFTMNYYSRNDWRSNNGVVTVTEPVITDLPKWRNKINYAIFAIDFVGPNNDLKAIDLNIAPGVPDSLYKILPPSQMVLSIKDWLRKYVNKE